MPILPLEEEYVVECPQCQHASPSNPISFIDVIENSDETWGWERIRYILATCQVCERALLLAHEDGNPVPERTSRVMWPTGDKSLSEAIPGTLRGELLEARACFRVNAYTASVVMVRRTLEGVCADHNIDITPLFRALEEMRRRGLIEGRMLEWAQELRVLGNSGAHFTGAKVSKSDARDALDLAEAMLDYLYVYTARFKEFKDRRIPGGYLDDEPPF